MIIGDQRPRQTARSTPSSSRTARAALRVPVQVAHDRSPSALVVVRRIFAAETGNYFLLLGTTLFLVTFGLVMVLSSSSVESHVANDNFFTSFFRQGLYALIGVPLMLIASRMPASFWRRMARPGILVGIALELLVFTPLGYSSGLNKNWISFGSFTAQPSELAKIALIVWFAFIFTRENAFTGDWKRVFAPIGAATAVTIGLVLFGNDLGTAIIMLFIVFGSMFFAGVRIRTIMAAGVVVGAFGLIVAFASLSRSARINAWLYGCSAQDYYSYCWQPTHGTWALAAGGIFGVGLGNSKAKWSWLPEADNDYIFAIIGEELGLIGAIVVLALFIVLAISFIRIMRMNPDPFARIVTSGVMVWIIGQALVNIAVVLGFLPVLGVPLPLISAGGSALISTLLAIGIVLSFARQHPDVEVGVGAPPRVAPVAASR